uniref:MHC class II beta chain N-terminal domain-containing protein n=1 Tax=Varanus komodoensis TaxID=61221 RepID=A0A8D2L0M1_VARKO
MQRWGGESGEKLPLPFFPCSPSGGIFAPCSHPPKGRWAQTPSCRAVGPLCCSLTGPGRVPPPPTAPRRFLHQDKSECRFSNVTGREQVRFLYRFIYDRAEIARYDSARGRYDALTPLGEPDVQLWNSQKEELEFWQNKVDTFCRYNYGVAAAGSIVGRRGECLRGGSWRSTAPPFPPPRRACPPGRWILGT